MVAKSSHFALHRLELGALPSGQPLLFPGLTSWVGAMAPKRWAKRAVTRNAIKRQIYTLSASLTLTSTHAAFLVRLRREFSRKDFTSASSALLKEAVRLELLDLLQNARATSQTVSATT